MRLIWLLSCLLSSLFADYSIIFVHIGDQVPSYTEIALSQARLFNPHARVILLGSDKGLKRLDSLKQINIELCSYDQIPKTTIHEKYERECVHNSPFWRYTSERFLYLWDFISYYSLENIFHLENDNMLYADLEYLLPKFIEGYSGIGATFDNEERCIPGFVWIANSRAMENLAQYFANKAFLGLNDMQIIGSYRKENSPDIIDSLPIIMPEYAVTYNLISPHFHTTTRPKSYSNRAEIFHAIFDAAAIGQFLGGIDPMHQNNGPGFINESCLFNPSLLQYHWELDQQKRAVPYAIFQGNRYQIINLHIHSKRLQEFISRPLA